MDNGLLSLDDVLQICFICAILFIPMGYYLSKFVPSLLEKLRRHGSLKTAHSLKNFEALMKKNSD